MQESWRLTFCTRAALDVVMIVRTGSTMMLPPQARMEAPMSEAHMVTVKPELQSLSITGPGQPARKGERRAKPADQLTTRSEKVKAEVKAEAVEIKPPRQVKASASVKAEAPTPAKPGAASTASARVKR